MGMQESFFKLRQIEHHVDDTVRLYRNREADDYPAHWHNAAEIIMPMENDYTVMVGQTAYKIEPGELFMVPAGVVHEIFAPEDGFRYLFLIDQREFYTIEGLPQVQRVLYPCVHLRADRDGAALEEIRGYFINAVREFDQDKALSPTAARLWLRLVLVRTAQHLLSDEAGERAQVTPRQHLAMTVLANACSYIAEHCAEKLTLDDMAAYCGYSKYHFARTFKLYSGMSFYDYYMRQRLVLCRRLLSNPQMRVTEVALQAGFDSIATFNRVFKQYEGVTPSQYRRMRQHAPRVV